MPLVTFALFSYNQEDYIKEAILGAFSQTYSHLEIIISDDHSSDRTFEIAKEMVSSYGGSHKVICLRNDKNIGLARHINKINSISNGELIVCAAGDDISMPQRTQVIVDEYLRYARVPSYFFSTAKKINLNSEVAGIINSPGIKNLNRKINSALSPHPIAIGATQAWTKLLVLSFGPLNTNISAEDQIFGFRGTLLGPVVHIDEPLVLYRVGSGISTRIVKFSITRYFSGKVNGIRMFQQRCIDAWHAEYYLLSTIIAGKILMLILILPLHPIISFIQKRELKKLVMK